MTKPDGGPAFPGQQDLTEQGWNQSWASGMTRRQWLVGEALPAVIGTIGHLDGCGDAKHVAELCHEVADAILEYEESENKEPEK